MNPLNKIHFLLALLIAMMMIPNLPTKVLSQEDSSILDDQDGPSNNEKPTSSAFLQNQDLASLRGTGRILTSSRSAKMTCDKYPRICRVKGSPGPDCCKKKCVDVTTDRLNCGKCGNKCKYSEICCKGKCVNPMNDKNHCGKCNNKCNKKKKNSGCVYGLCSYA